MKRTKCQCESPGWCKRHQCHKGPHFHHLCQNNKKYFSAWEEGRGPGQVNVKAEPRRHGPGYELAKILGWFGIKETPACHCKLRSHMMDAWGPDKCLEKADTIVGWMREEANKRRLPFSELAARGILWLAIRRARRVV